MRISQPSNVLLYLPLYIGLENSEHQIINYDGPMEAIKALSKKQADISISDPFMFNYLDYDEDDIIIFAGFISKVMHSLITFDPFIEKLDKKILNGKIIVSYPEPSTSFFLSRNLKKEYGLGNVIETPFNTELGPLLTQEGDVAIVLEPNTSYALRNGARELMDFSIREAVMTGFCVTNNYMAKNKKELIGFLNLVKKGIEIFYNKEEETLLIAKKYFPLVEETILIDAINKIRKAKPYCLNFEFTDNEIGEGLILREIDLPVQKVKNFIVKPYMLM